MSTALYRGILFLLIMIPCPAGAGDEPNFAAPGKTDVISSGADADVLEQNCKAVEKVDAVLELLGIARPNHRLEFVPSDELPQLAALGRPAVGHWHDGSIVATQARSAMGVLEFVTPGPVCRSFYSDSTRPEQQIEIFKHVAGHNDFAVHSMYSQMRQPSDVIMASHQLYEFMESAYIEHEYDEVAQWYQYLMTLAHAQDLARGTFESPEKKSWKGSTPHELQFTVANLPTELPAWKKEMVRLFEQMERVKGYYFSAKIMNEGWATFLQDFLIPYLPWQDDHHVFESAELKTGVAYPRISNPYWLGREAWRNLYRNFKERPEIKVLSSLERDRKFVEFAHEIIWQEDDYRFLRRAFDRHWVDKHHLFLYRKAERNEIDPRLPPPQGQEDVEQKIIVSTDAEKILAHLAKRLADRTIQVPRVHVENKAASGRNVYSLSHEVIDGIPLRKESMVGALFIRSQIWQRPVSLKTIAPAAWFPRPRAMPRFFWDFSEIEKEPDPEPIPIRVEVDPIGKVQVFRREVEPTQEKLDEKLTGSFQRILQGFIEELEGSSNSELEEAQKKKFAPLMDQTTDLAGRATLGLISHSMTSASAVLRYLDMVNRRLYSSVQRALQGKAPLKRTAGGARVQVLPPIPEFELDPRFQFEPGQKFHTFAMQVGMAATDLGGGEETPLEGDRFWGKADPQGGEGEGDGEEEEGDEGEEGEQPGQGSGGESSNPSEIDVPLQLFGELLKENIELPNLRPKAGPSRLKEPERDGARQRSYGDILWNRVVPKALVLGKMALEKHGTDFEKKYPSKIDRRKILKEGMKYIQPDDWIVPGAKMVPRPDINAVIAIWMDMTGSMTGEPIRLAKQFMFNLKALLSTKYKNIQFRYVGFADEAREFPTERSFFKAFLGGGTDYSTGIQKTREILGEYNEAMWDKYSFGIGDAQDGNSAESSRFLRDLVSETQYSGFIHTDIGWADPLFVKTMEELGAEDQYFGYAVLKPGIESGLDAVRKLLGKKERNS